MDLSKAYDCLSHDLLIPKFKIYRFDFNSLCLVYSYLDCNNQKAKVGSLRSAAKGMKICILQGCPRPFPLKLVF